MSRFELIEPGGSKIDLADTERVEAHLRRGQLGYEAERDRLMATWPDDSEDDAA